MDAIQKTLIKAGRRDLAKKYYKIVSKKEVMLKTKAKSSGGYTYDVVLRQDKDDKYHYGVILDIKNTPGSWYMSTIMEGTVPTRFVVDAGQKWYVDNAREIIKEALSKLEKRTIYLLK